jgi:uncharacterized protein (TIGR03382 family)
MKYLTNLGSAVAVAVALSATSASALTTTLDFGTKPNSGTVAALNYTFGTVNVAVSGNTTAPAPGRVINGTAFVINDHSTKPNLGGLGVKATLGSQTYINNGVDKNDLLVLDFGTTVKLKSALFSFVEGNDIFDFWVDGVYQFSANAPFLASYLFNVKGKTFGFGATLGGNTALTRVDYKVRNVVVSAVPLPPAGILLAMGLMGLGALGRRRKKAA